MARKCREKCRNSIYHITSRGNNKQDIFLDDEDRKEFLARLLRYKERYQMHIYAYCLMSNHIHLLIYDNDQDISRFMQGLSLSYAIYFNKKYQRSGHLFQERYYSVIVKNDMQLMYTSKYIHLNPVRAQLAEKATEYKWSSYRAYEEGKDIDGIVQVNFLLELFCQNRSKAKREYRKYVNSEVEDSAQSETAITSEEEKTLSEMMVGLPRVSAEQVFFALEVMWDKKIREILTSTDNSFYEKKLILVYLTTLLGRVSYKEASRILQLQVNEVYKIMRQLIERMIYNQGFKKQINQLINTEWKNYIRAE